MLLLSFFEVTSFEVDQGIFIIKKMK